MTKEHYKALQKANSTLQEINEIMGAFNETLQGLQMPPLQKLVVQGYMLQVVQAVNDYSKYVEPMLKENE